MHSEEELTSLFTDYFGDRLSPTQLDTLVTDVMTAVQNRRARPYSAAHAPAPASQPAEFSRLEFAW